MPDLPNSLALTTIADGASIIASDHRNNYAAVATGVNGLITALSGGTVGQFLRATDTDTVTYAYPPGYEYAYAEKTTNTSITATTEGTANTVVTASAVTFDGSTAINIEFYSTNVAKGTTQTTLYLYDGASSIGLIGLSGASAATVRTSVRITPSAAAHTYSVRASVDAGTGQVTGGTGGIGAAYPAFIKITKA